MITNNETNVLTRKLKFSRTMKKTPPAEFSEGRYSAKLATTRREVESALRLRYEVFNVELAADCGTNSGGLEFDEYDAICRHLLIVDNSTGRTVGTYRLNSIETAGGANGFYSSKEFSVEDLPGEILRQSIEIGRACIAPAHRNSKVLFLLWKGLLNHLIAARKRYFFGCCSFFTRDPNVGAQVYRRFLDQNLIHPTLKVKPRAERALPLPPVESEKDRVELPGLFNLYLKIGAKICGAPIIDPEFGTIDFFVIFDLLEMDEKYRKMFFR